MSKRDIIVKINSNQFGELVQSTHIAVKGCTPYSKSKTEVSKEIARIMAATGFLCFDDYTGKHIAINAANIISYIVYEKVREI